MTPTPTPAASESNTIIMPDSRLNFKFIGCADYDVRLYGGSNPNNRTVEVCFDEAWETVCGFSWSNNEAEVVCRQLGIDGGK